MQCTETGTAEGEQRTKGEEAKQDRVLLEWAGNAVGTLGLLWATVVLLGGFCSLLSRGDFWFSTVMIFMEATRSRCAAA